MSKTQPTTSSSSSSSSPVLRRLERTITSDAETTRTTTRTTISRFGSKKDLSTTTRRGIGSLNSDWSPTRRRSRGKQEQRRTTTTKSKKTNETKNTNSKRTNNGVIISTRGFASKSPEEYPPHAVIPFPSLSPTMDAASCGGRFKKARRSTPGIF